MDHLFKKIEISETSFWWLMNIPTIVFHGWAATYVRTHLIGTEGVLIAAALWFVGLNRLMRLIIGGWERLAVRRQEEQEDKYLQTIIRSVRTGETK